MRFKKKVYKVSLYPKPYKVMVEAVDKITARQEALQRLEINPDWFDRISAITEYENKMKETTCAVERLAVKRLKKKGYI